jgi:hypothetical protein
LSAYHDGASECSEIGDFLQNVDADPNDLLYIVEMSAASFLSWLDAMGFSAAEAARQLGVNANTVTRYKRKGGPKMLALACAALYHRQESWK